MEDEITEPEKTSSWTDTEREAATPAVPAIPPASAEASKEELTKAPPWASSFRPGTMICHKGYWCRILFIGEAAPGQWGVLIVPTARDEQHRQEALAFAALRADGVGKKEAKRRIRKARREATDTDAA